MSIEKRRILDGMHDVMPDYFSIIEEISKKLNKPCYSTGETTFVLEKNNCHIGMDITELGILVQGFVGGAGLCLDSMALSDFIARLRELSFIHPASRFIIIEVSPLSPEFSEGLYPIFPRIVYALAPLENWSNEKIANFVEGTYQILARIQKIVKKFRASDKSFDSLQGFWEKVLSSRDRNEKGRLLEDFLSLLITKDENFSVKERNLRTESEELDIIAENTGMTHFYLQLKCPIISFECKNWSSKIGSKEIRDFAQKIQNRSRVLCNIGVLVTTSKLTKKAFTELIGYRGKDFLIAILDRKDIETILSKRLPLGELLRGAIREAALR